MATLDRQMGQSPICLSKGGVHILREPKSGVHGPTSSLRQQWSAFGLPPLPPLAADVICERPLTLIFSP